MTERLLTLREASERLACSYSYLYRNYRQGLIKVVKVGRFVRISERDLDLWIHANEIVGAIITKTADARANRTQRERDAGLIPASDLRSQAT